MLKQKQLIIPTNREKDIVADITYSDIGENKPLVIFCHGYKGFKDWGAWNLVAKTFAEAGFIFLKFNFSHNGGTIENPIDFPDLEAFGKNTYTKEVEDLHTVINWSQSNNGFPILKNNSTVIGHSRGAGIATIVAKEHSAVARLITWAGVSDFESRFLKNDDLQQWKEKGVFTIKNSRTKQKMPHFYTFYEDFVQNKHRLTIKNAVKQLRKPQLILHGDSDEAVNIKEAYNYKKWNPNAVLIEIKGANHTFGSKHPWTENQLPSHLKQVVKYSIDFVKGQPKVFVTLTT